MLEPHELKTVRDQAQQSLPETVDLLAPNAITDGRGGMTRSYAISHVGIPARIAQRTGRETMFAGQDQVRADYILTVAYDQLVDETMRVDHNGTLYDIVFVSRDRSYDTARLCLLHRR